MRRSGPCGRNPAKGCEALRCRLGADQRHRGLPPRKIGEPYRALANWISRGVLQNRGRRPGRKPAATWAHCAENRLRRIRTDDHALRLARIFIPKTRIIGVQDLETKLFSCECAGILGGVMPQDNGPPLANGSDAMPNLSSSLPAGSPRSAGGNRQGWPTGLDKDKRPDRTMSRHDCHPGLALRHALSSEAIERAYVGARRASLQRVFCKCPGHGSGLPAQ